MTVSRPCRTCRSRKKACDKTRPHCNSCYKSGYRCEGYDSFVKGVFVNLDTQSINVPKKPLITKATLSARKLPVSKVEADRKSHPPRRKEISVLSPHLLDLSPAEFQHHFVTLWAHFQENYARTPNDWSIEVSGLALHQRALDLALISLATMRLSVCGQSERYQVFSLTAYNGSLQIFQRLLQNGGQGSKGILVVISLVFTLFEAAQQYPAQIYQTGWAGHLKGALLLMQRQGPSTFQRGGLHAAFKKLREMAMLLSLSTQNSSFLAQPQWIEVPWAIMKKSSRDRLYDIATEITTLHSRKTDRDEILLQLHLRIYDKLIDWRKGWLEADYPDLQILCRGCSEQPCGCFPHQSMSPCNEFSFITAEAMSFLLIVTFMALHIAKGLEAAPTGAIFIRGHNPDVDSLRQRCLRLKGILKENLSLPCFGQAISDKPGITEGRCRSLFPNWVLSQDPDVQGPEVDWWCGLNSRVNFGIV